MSSTRIPRPTSLPPPPSAVLVVPTAAKQTSPLLAAYLLQLAAHPLRTKSITLAVLQFAQEILASHLAGLPARRVPADAPLHAHVLARARIDARAVKMAAYGAFVSAPLGHALVGLLQRAFAGRTGVRARVLQILASNLVVSPIQISVYLASMAVINGAKSVDEVVATVRAGFMKVMRITWVTSPVSLVFAQRYLAPEMWVPFFNFIQFVAGTYFNTKVKKMHLAKKKQDESKEE